MRTWHRDSVKESAVRIADSIAADILGEKLAANFGVMVWLLIFPIPQRRVELPKHSAWKLASRINSYYLRNAQLRRATPHPHTSSHDTPESLTPSTVRSRVVECKATERTEDHAPMIADLKAIADLLRSCAQ